MTEPAGEERIRLRRGSFDGGSRRCRHDPGTFARQVTPWPSPSGRASSWFSRGAAGRVGTPLAAAQASVTAKEEALAEAEDAATAAAAEFCTASTDYVIAIDRYGDVLNATAPTVGDVKEAGSDLAQPGRTRRRPQRTLGCHATPWQRRSRNSPRPGRCLRRLRPQQPARRRRRARRPRPPARPRRRLLRVSRGCRRRRPRWRPPRTGSPIRPLAQAAEQFNAAAVALEMAWLQLIGDSGCLTDAQQDEAAKAVRSYTTTLQQALSDAGYYTADVDGVYGPKTVAAVEALQKANGLPQTGTLDKATEKALRSELAAKGGAAAQQQTASTAAVQQTLKLAATGTVPSTGSGPRPDRRARGGAEGPGGEGHRHRRRGDDRGRREGHRRARRQLLHQPVDLGEPAASAT